MTISILLIILGMAFVTFVPKLLPFISINNEKLSPKVKGVLNNIPFAILGALIFPGVFTVHTDIWVGIIGTAIAFLCAYLRLNVLIVMLCSIGSIVLYLIIP
ncbi:AzlD domain-containing protein [Bacillus sp. 165]|uniref:AzlD domain-containing protein n=1 Tax=Bacillus sp. 165 TaxID=1529117 RepID=UPI001ADAA787|nr:AzlD domain-containing protein [Bacillus sp. 165]MBO9128466.1 AzlD domain-containing protein [Bacillus sp. 165]